MLNVEDYMNYLSLKLFEIERNNIILDDAKLKMITKHASEEDFNKWYATHYVSSYVCLFKSSFDPKDYFITYDSIKDEFEFPSHKLNISSCDLLLLELTFLSNRGVEVVNVRKFNELQTNIGIYNSLHGQSQQQQQRQRRQSSDIEVIDDDEM